MIFTEVIRKSNWRQYQQMAAVWRNCSFLDIDTQLVDKTSVYILLLMRTIQRYLTVPAISEREKIIMYRWITRSETQSKDYAWRDCCSWSNIFYILWSINPVTHPRCSFMDLTPAGRRRKYTEPWKRWNSRHRLRMAGDAHKVTYENVWVQLQNFNVKILHWYVVTVLDLLKGWSANECNTNAQKCSVTII
jgi:hypothetical protein